MTTLNLPSTTLKTRVCDGKLYVWDILRHRYILVTPEEWVRQHFIHFLIEHKGYPAAMLGNEISLMLGDTKKRCDSVLYDNQAKARMIIEYKAPHVQITQKTFDQITRYNIALHVDYLIVSNGIQHYCCKVDYATGKCCFLQDIPCYEAL